MASRSGGEEATKQGRQFACGLRGLDAGAALFEFFPAGVKLWDLDAFGFELGLEREGFVSVFGVEIWGGKEGFDAGDFAFGLQDFSFHAFPLAFFFPR